MTDDVTAQPNEMEDIARVWRKSRDIIAKFLRELVAGQSQNFYEHNAAAIIARLAHANPPLLIEESKEDR